MSLIDGASELFVDLDVPEVVIEGDSFTPRVVVSRGVVAQFLVYSSDSTALSSEDYEFTPELVEFSPANSTLSTSSPVTAVADTRIEADEAFILNVQLASPLNFGPFLEINNPSKVITILDNNSECQVIRFSFTIVMLRTYFCML